MNQQPEALRLADDLDAYHTRSIHKESAIELRRLYAENEALKAELQEQARVTGMGGERELKLMAENEALRKDAEQRPAAHGEPVGYVATEDLEDQREYPSTCRVVNIYFDQQGGTEAVYTAPQPTPALVQAAKQALDALDAELSDNWKCNSYHPKIYEAMNALRARLENRHG